jgi:hypothetical protein
MKELSPDNPTATPYEHPPVLSDEQFAAFREDLKEKMGKDLERRHPRRKVGSTSLASELINAHLWRDETELAS